MRPLRRMAMEKKRRLGLLASDSQLKEPHKSHRRAIQSVNAPQSATVLSRSPRVAEQHNAGRGLISTIRKSYCRRPVDCCYSSTGNGERISSRVHC